MRKKVELLLIFGSANNGLMRTIYGKNMVASSYNADTNDSCHVSMGYYVNFSSEEAKKGRNIGNENNVLRIGS